MSIILHVLSILHPIEIIKVLQKQKKVASPPSPKILQINLIILQHISIWLMPQNFWN